MANTTNLLEALSSYQGDQQSLTHFVETAKQELGENWMESIYQTLPNLPSSLKEKLDHAFQYHGASLSWNEIQSYLLSQSPLDIEAVSNRIETLAHWLNFFGEPGESAIQQLKDKLDQEKERQLLLQPENQELPILEEDPIQSDSLIETDYIVSVKEEIETIPVDEPSILQTEEELMDQPEETFLSNDQDNDDSGILQNIEEADTTEYNEPQDSSEEYNENNNNSEEYVDENYDYQEDYLEEDGSYNQEDYLDETYQQPISSDENFNDEPALYNEPQYSSEEYNENADYSEEYADENYNYQENYSEEDGAYDQEDYPEEAYQPISSDENFNDKSNLYDETQYSSEEYDETNNNFEEYADENYDYQEDYLEEDGAYDQEDYYSEEYNSDEDTDPLQDIEPSNWRTPVYQQQPAETNEEFMAKKVFHQLDFLTAVRCWINARCISLGNKEIYSYRHYGFLIDVMEEAKKDLKIVLASPTFYPAIEKVRKDGLNQLQSSLKSLESDLKIAYDNLPSELTDLIADSTNVDDLRRALGAVDTSNKPELLGVAPDGFEMLEDPFVGIDTEKTKITSSQKDQNSIQKKKTFSFNKKNAS